MDCAKRTLFFRQSRHPFCIRMEGKRSVQHVMKSPNIVFSRPAPQNSIRHNLSLHGHFVRIQNEISIKNGSGWWTVDFNVKQRPEHKKKRVRPAHGSDAPLPKRVKKSRPKGLASSSDTPCNVQHPPILYCTPTGVRLLPPPPPLIPLPLPQTSASNFTVLQQRHITPASPQ